MSIVSRGAANLHARRIPGAGASASKALATRLEAEPESQLRQGAPFSYYTVLESDLSGSQHRYYPQF